MNHTTSCNTSATGASGSVGSTGAARAADSASASGLAGLAAPRWLRRLVDAFWRGVDALNPRTRLAIALFLVVAVPAGVLLHHLESQGRAVLPGLPRALPMSIYDDVVLAVALYLAGALVLCIPVAGLVCRFVLLRDIREINTFCLALREGRQPRPLALPNEQEDEHDLLRLKRNLEWMAHLVASRERHLMARLEATDSRARHMEELAVRDALTGLFNRRHFERRLAELAADARLRPPFHLMLVDCDRFKAVNDTHGHAAGDELLRLLGDVIAEAVRAGTDTPCRIGGDEFGILFACPDENSVRAVAERIRLRFSQCQNHGCTLSIGIARYRQQGEGRADAACQLAPVTDAGNAACAGEGAPLAVQAMVARADGAVYAVKRRGGDGIAVR